MLAVCNICRLQTRKLYVVLPLPSLIANLTNLTGVLVWLTGLLVWQTEVLVWRTEVASLADWSARLKSAFVAHHNVGR